MIAIIDYGMGNLRSVQKAMEKIGAQALITQNLKDIQKADKLILPGVGAIKPAMERLESLGLISAIKSYIDTGKPFLGICLGYQLLFENSFEGGQVQGLGILKGSVEKFPSLKIPHMGWNQIILKQPDCPLLKGIEDKSNTYFCHSYYVKPADNSIICTSTDYGIDFASAICRNNLFGCQFHPEKSQEIGLRILKNFKELAS